MIGHVLPPFEVGTTASTGLPSGQAVADLDLHLGLRTQIYDPVGGTRHPTKLKLVKNNSSGSIDPSLAVELDETGTEITGQSTAASDSTALCDPVLALNGVTSVADGDYLYVVTEGPAKVSTASLTPGDLVVAAAAGALAERDGTPEPYEQCVGRVMSSGAGGSVVYVFGGRH